MAANAKIIHASAFPRFSFANQPENSDTSALQLVTVSQSNGVVKDKSSGSNKALKIDSDLAQTDIQTEPLLTANRRVAQDKITLQKCKNKSKI